MNAAIIYRITNDVNPKVYIGQTRQGLARRKSEHIYRCNFGDRDHKLYMAMRKHGVEKFHFEEYATALSPDSLNELEKNIISDYNSYNRGYNATEGGDGVSDETRAKISKALMGREITWAHKMAATRKLNGTYGKPMPKGANSKLAKSYLIKFPDGSEQKITGINKFCQDHSLTAKCLYSTLGGDQYQHKGYSLLVKFND